ncbi:MAG: hypothetical protein H6Q70_2072 [Firmicutes bacterium]|nr:hypothetical protein [Bacillota bacterium]
MMNRRYFLKYTVRNFNAKIAWIKLENIYVVDQSSFSLFKVLILKNKYLKARKSISKGGLKHEQLSNAI